MARYTGPKTKIARKFGEPIYGPDKNYEKEIILRDNMAQQREERKSLNMACSCRRNKKQNTPMAFWKDSLEISS